MADPLAIRPSPKLAAFIARAKRTLTPVRFIVRPVHPPLTLPLVREIRRLHLMPPHPTITMLAHDYEQTERTIRDVLTRATWYDEADDLAPLIRSEPPR